MKNTTKAATPIADNYRIEYVKLGELRQLIGNPKKHSPMMLVRSLNEFGFTSPHMIDESTGVLVAGHGRLRALFNMRASGAPPPARVMTIDDDWAVPVVRGVHFASAEAAKAYAIADNRVQEAGGWDDDKLAAMLREIDESNKSLVAEAGVKPVDLGSLGLTSAEVDRLLREQTGDQPTVKVDTGGSPFAKSVTLSLVFDSITERDAVKALLGEESTKTNKRSGTIVRELLERRAAKKKPAAKPNGKAAKPS